MSILVFIWYFIVGNVRRGVLLKLTYLVTLLQGSVLKAELDPEGTVFNTRYVCDEGQELRLLGEDDAGNPSYICSACCSLIIIQWIPDDSHKNT